MIGGGEFAFVVLNLADKLNVIPPILAKLLVGLVVISMALTPLLDSLGAYLATIIEKYEKNKIYEKFQLNNNSNERINNKMNGFIDVEVEVEDENDENKDIIIINGFNTIG